MNTLEAKILAIIGLAVPCLGFSLLPSLIYRFAHARGFFESPYSKTIVLATISFSGGTLLGVAFLHLLPEMRYQLEEKSFEETHKNHQEKHEEKYSDLPWPDIITVGGFLAAYLIDEVMHIVVEHCVEKGGREVEKSVEIEAVESFQGTSVTAKASNRSTRSLRHFHDTHALVTNVLEEDMQVPTLTPISHHMALNEFVGPTDTEMKEESSPPKKVESRSASMGGVLTVGALSLHELVEGLAIGIEKSVPGVLFLFLSVAVHKFATGFCIGADLAVAKTRKWPLFITMLMFSIITPAGVLIGMIMTATRIYKGNPIGSSTANGILQGIAGGNLIYVVCFEILQREATQSHKAGILSLIFVLIGFLFTLGIRVSATAISGGHSHNHG